MLSCSYAYWSGQLADSLEHNSSDELPPVLVPEYGLQELERAHIYMVHVGGRCVPNVSKLSARTDDSFLVTIGAWPHTVSWDTMCRAYAQAGDRTSLVTFSVRHTADLGPAAELLKLVAYDWEETDNNNYVGKDLLKYLEMEVIRVRLPVLGKSSGVDSAFLRVLTAAHR